MKTFSILGAGWLGLELAKCLQNEFNIKVSSRTKEKLNLYENLKFEAYVLNEKEVKNLDKLLECNYLLINYPPSKFEDFIKFLDNIYSNKNIKDIEKIIFISSTSIYPKEDGTYNENSHIINSSSQKVFEIEKFIKERTDVILRCAGLIGGDRIAGKRLSKKELEDSNSKVNHVHRIDVIRAIKFIIEKNINGIFNLSAPINPSKKEVYSKNSFIYKFQNPIFLYKFEKNRIIDGSKITSYGFEYKYKNPLEFSK